MSDFNYMPLTGAVLISNPRRGSHMPARMNPNWYRRANKAARSATSQRRASARKKLRAKYRRQGGPNWYSKAALRSKYESEAKKGGVSAKGLLSFVSGGKATKTSASRRKAMYSRRKSVAGKYATWGKSKSKAYKFVKHQRDAKGRFVKGGRKVIRAANARRLHIRRRSPLASKFRVIDSSTGKGKWVDGYKGVKVSGYILEHLPKKKKSTKRKAKGRKAKSRSTTRRRTASKRSVGSRRRDSKGRFLKAGARKATTRKSSGRKAKSTGRRRTARKAKSAGKKRRPSAYNKFVGAYMRKGHTMKQAAHAWKLGNRKARPNRGKRSYGALALKNRGFGALALKNGLALENGVAVASIQDGALKGLKLAGSGVAGMIAYHYVSPVVEDLVSKVPVAGDFLLDLSVPEFVPVIGGAGLSNTVSGIIGGLALGTISIIAARFSGIREIGEYGAVFSAGMAVIGGALDTAAFFEGASDDLSDDELGALALDNYGALALDNYGALALDNYGDGMAYQLGGIGDEFSQASLADAFYSGADFSLGEGQALLNGKRGYMRRFGRPAHRVARHGGSQSGPSHMAGQPGHKWGWLVKMLGWEGASQVARQPPQQRVQTIAALRANAIATLKQIQETSQIEEVAAPEFGPIHAQGSIIPQGAVHQYAQHGAQGVGSSFGSTIFAGQGL